MSLVPIADLVYRLNFCVPMCMCYRPLLSGSTFKFDSHNIIGLSELLRYWAQQDHARLAPGGGRRPGRAADHRQPLDPIDIISSVC